ncbi:MAG: sigma-70 family RNA polymerase sigma factor [Crocinitomix sp.]|nr:sigma-70 family RNA polymerase sigma factor [Crocinitomix sp.]
MLFSALFRKNIRKLSDLELVELVKKSDDNALAELFKRYAPLVMGLCLKYLKDSQVAEDLMMEIFEKLTEKLLKHEVRNFKSWLFSLSRNECLMVLRKSKLDTMSLDNSLIYQEDTSDKAYTGKIETELKLEALDKAMDVLGEDQHKAIRLFYFDFKSYDEIAKLMETSINKVKSLIQNGKRNLKIKLENGNEF